MALEDDFRVARHSPTFGVRSRTAEGLLFRLIRQAGPMRRSPKQRDLAEGTSYTLPTMKRLGGWKYNRSFLLIMLAACCGVAAGHGGVLAMHDRPPQSVVDRITGTADSNPGSLGRKNVSLIAPTKLVSQLQENGAAAMDAPGKPRTDAAAAEDRAIALAKDIDVSRLDRKLRSQKLDQWLRSGPPHLDRVDWSIAEDIACPGGPRQAQACVRFVFARCRAARCIDGEGIIRMRTKEKAVLQGLSAGAAIGGYVVFDSLSELADLDKYVPPLTDEEKRLINMVMQVDVHKLDPSLASQSLEEWLQSGQVQSADTVWSMSLGCDLKFPPNSEGDGYPLCVKFAVRRGSGPWWVQRKKAQLGFGLILVGSWKAGKITPVSPRYFSPGALSDLPHNLVTLGK